MWGKKTGAIQGEILAEPLSYVQEWKLARILGNESKIGHFLSQLKHLDEGGTLASILKNLTSAQLKNEPSLKIIDEEPLAVFGRRFHYLNNNHEESLIVGSPSEILAHVEIDPYDDMLGSQAVSKQYEQASQQGFLVLAFAWANVKSTKKLLSNHKLIGLALIEPTISPTHSKKAPIPTRFYSSAHSSLAAHIIEQALDLNIENFLEVGELSARPQDWQKQIEATQLIGGCSDLLKLQLKNFWQAQGAALTLEPFLEVR